LELLTIAKRKKPESEKKREIASEKNGRNAFIKKTKRVSQKGGKNNGLKKRK